MPREGSKTMDKRSKHSKQDPVRNHKRALGLSYNKLCVARVLLPHRGGCQQQGGSNCTPPLLLRELQRGALSHEAHGAAAGGPPRRRHSTTKLPWSTTKLPLRIRPNRVGLHTMSMPGHRPGGATALQGCRGAQQSCPGAHRPKIPILFPPQEIVFLS